MLQHNTPAVSRGAHVTHAAVVALHALCCGIPVLALMMSAISGATSGVALLAEIVSPLHALVHSRELWILGLSSVLVALGGGLEIANRRQGRRLPFPWLFAVSATCLLVNVAVIAAHR